MLNKEKEKMKSIPREALPDELFCHILECSYHPKIKSHSNIVRTQGERNEVPNQGMGYILTLEGKIEVHDKVWQTDDEGAERSEKVLPVLGVNPPGCTERRPFRLRQSTTCTDYRG